MHLLMPHPRHRFDASNWHHLGQAANRFATQFYPPDGRREGEQQQSNTENNIPPSDNWVWVQNEHGEWTKHQKGAKT
jgi:GAG-pre-integrase domain